jgi:hypothetical protein
MTGNSVAAHHSEPLQPADVKLLEPAPKPQPLSLLRRMFVCGACSTTRHGEQPSWSSCSISWFGSSVSSVFFAFVCIVPLWQCCHERLCCAVSEQQASGYEHCRRTSSHAPQQLQRPQHIPDTHCQCAASHCLGDAGATVHICSPSDGHDAALDVPLVSSPQRSSGPYPTQQQQQQQQQQHRQQQQQQQQRRPWSPAHVSGALSGEWHHVGHIRVSTSSRCEAVGRRV